MCRIMPQWRVSQRLLELSICWFGLKGNSVSKAFQAAEENDEKRIFPGLLEYLYACYLVKRDPVLKINRGYFLKHSRYRWKVSKYTPVQNYWINSSSGWEITQALRT